MYFKEIVLLVLLSTFSVSYSQSVRIDEFGKPSQEELELRNYEPEPDAPGVILYESGNYYAVSIIKKTAVRLVMEIHRKVKVLDAKKFEYSTVEIPYFEGAYSGEEVMDYKAVTHNGEVKHFVPD